MAKWGNCDYKQLQQLRENIAHLQGIDMDKFCKDMSKELARKLLQLVIRRTPVGRYDGETYTCAMGKTHQAHTVKGKVGGTLRRGWTAKSQGEAENGSGNGMSKVASYAAALPVKKSGNAYTVEVINPVGYASYVEYGHRQQPGRFIPGYWESDRFVYDPDAEGGMVLKKNWVKGRYMLTISTQELEQQAPKLLEKKLYNFLKGCFDA